MKMKKFSILIIALGLLLTLPLLGADKDENDNTVDIKIKVGAKVTGEKDFQDKVNEYQKVQDGVRPLVKAKISGSSGKTYFDIYSAFLGDVSDMFHRFNLDFGRVLKQKFEFNALYHRLDHDPLTNIDVVSEARSAAYHEDFNPNDQYHITRNEFISNTTLTIPGLSFLKVHVDFRNEHRKGEYQARTLSKCSTCHVVAKTRPINSINRDIRVGSDFRVGKANLNYSFTHNQFRERESAPMNDYLAVKHPENLLPVFTSRIAYGNDTSLAFDSIPDSKKDSHLFQAAIPVAANSTISAQFLNARVTNELNNLKWKTNSFAGGFSTLFGNKGFFNVRFQHIKIDNDSVFVDTPEPKDTGGPNAGLTYAEKYGGVYDFNRLSALSRTVLDIDANFRYRFNKKLRVKLGYEYKSIDREYYDVSTTKSNTFKAELKFKPVSELKLTVDGTIKKISDPFINLYAGSAPLMQSVGVPNPFVGVQFPLFHEARMNHLGNLPEDVAELKAKLAWSPSSKFGINGSIVYRDETNDAIDDNLNGIDANWNRNMLQWGIDMWAALSEKLPFTASFYNYKNQYESIFSIPVIEGCGAGIIGGMPGSLTDMYGYDIDTQTLLLNLHWVASKNVSFHLGFNYNKSLSEIVELNLNEGQVSFLPGAPGVTDLDFDNMIQVAEYSRLEMTQTMAECGVSVQLNKNWGIHGSFFYYFYDDMAEYLFTDTTGKTYSFFAGFSWSK